MTAARKAGLVTMSDVAKFLGVSKTFVSRVFSGEKRMPADKAAKFEERTGYRFKK